MPRYDSQNLAAIDPDFRRQHNLDNGPKKNTRYTYGKNVLIAAGNELMANGLCLRLMPIYEEGTNNFANFREGPDGVAMGDWCRLMTVAHWVGNPGVCFIAHDGDPNKDIRENPYNLLYNVAWKNKETPGIGRLFSELLQKPKVLQSSIGSLTKPEKMLFISASIVSVDDRGQVALSAFLDDPKKNARIIGLKFSALQSVFSALKARDQETGEFLCGDMLSMGPAKLLTILPESFSSGQQKVLGIGEHGQETFFCPKYARGPANAQYVVGYPPPDRRSAFTHFAFVHDTFNGKQISLEQDAERIVAEAGSWDQHLNILSFEEQAELLAPAFPREALEFAWQDYPQYLRALSRRPSNPTAPAPVSEFEDDENDEAVRAFSQPARKAPPQAAPAPVRQAAPAAPFDAPEISAEEAAGVADMFSVPESVSDAPSAPPAGPVATGKLNAADILARAKSRLSANK
jgi:hypothetical protein